MHSGKNYSADVKNPIVSQTYTVANSSVTSAVVYVETNSYVKLDTQICKYVA